MPNIKDKDYEIKYYYTDPCTKEECCIEKETILNFEDFDPIFAPVFVDMLVTAHKTLRNFLTEGIKRYGDYKYEIHLKYPMEVGTIIGSEELPRRYWLSDFRGRDKIGSYIYRLKSTDDLSVNETDESLLKKGIVIYRKGQFKNKICR